MIQTTRDIDLTRTYFFTEPLSLALASGRTANLASVQLSSAGETQVAGSPVWTVQVSNDLATWTDVSGATLTGAGLLQPVAVPTAGWLRAQLTTKSATATDRGHLSIDITEQLIS